MIAATADGYINIEIENANAFSLGSAYPNPFNPSTSFNLNINNDSYVSIIVYDLNGKLVETLYEGNMYQGMHRMTWNGQDVSSGTYIVRAISGNNVSAQKLMLIK